MEENVNFNNNHFLNLNGLKSSEPLSTSLNTANPILGD